VLNGRPGNIPQAACSQGCERTWLLGSVEISIVRAFRQAR
jgi:hypothetical protein